MLWFLILFMTVCLLVYFRALRSGKEVAISPLMESTTFAVRLPCKGGGGVVGGVVGSGGLSAGGGDRAGTESGVSAEVMVSQDFREMYVFRQDLKTS